MRFVRSKHSGCYCQEVYRKCTSKRSLCQSAATAGERASKLLQFHPSNKEINLDCRNADNLMESSAAWGCFADDFLQLSFFVLLLSNVRKMCAPLLREPESWGFPSANHCGPRVNLEGCSACAALCNSPRSRRIRRSKWATLEVYPACKRMFLLNIVGSGRSFYSINGTFKPEKRLANLQSRLKREWNSMDRFEPVRVSNLNLEI